jgi:ATP phosphoribosyltransferase
MPVNTQNSGADWLTFALPKGRLEEQTREYFSRAGIDFSFEKRKLVARDEENRIEFFLVKNSDLPTYVHHGIAGLGVCGEDVLYEASYPLNRLMQLPFGSTRMCLAGPEGAKVDMSAMGGLRVATKFTRFTRDYFHSQNIPVEMIKLNGSVELAPVLGLTPYIVDLVETGGTLKANKLAVLQELSKIHVHLVCNPAYYKYHHERIDAFISRIAGLDSGEGV